jgi:uncharacterized repeat protein (TIGR01451 family)
MNEELSRMKFQSRPSLLRLLMTACLALALPGLALAEGLKLENEAFQEIVVKAKNGKTEKKRQKVTNAVPGSEIIYVITYRNTGTKPVTGVVVNDDLPANLAYVAGSAEGAPVVVSVDGGKTFGALEKLTAKGSDGKPRAAQAGDVTHVRWTVAGAVAPGKSGSVSYRARVK